MNNINAALRPEIRDQLIVRDGVERLREALVRIAQGKPYFDTQFNARHAQRYAQYVLDDLGILW